MMSEDEVHYLARAPRHTQSSVWSSKNGVKLIIRLMFESRKYQKIAPMTTNLNEECLLDFLKKADESLFTTNAALAQMLKGLGIEIKFQNPNPVYDIIDEYEYI